MSLPSAPQIQSRRDAGGFGLRIARRAILARLERIARGELVLRENQETFRFGDGIGPKTEIQVHDARFYDWLVWGGTLGAAEAFALGFWSCDDLVSLFRLMSANERTLTGLDSGVARVAKFFNALRHRLRGNTLQGSRGNIAKHYDLGDEFFSLFLDETMTYSCGIFSSADSSLKDASLEKYERICRKLELTSDDRLLEIGSGWGGFAIYAATHYGCRVVTTTISQKQFRYAANKVRDLGLADRIEVIGQHTPKHTQHNDKIASIEMIEAVGHDHLDGFFGKCSELMSPNGTMVLQAITLPDHVIRRYLRGVDFIRHYIFPGGCLVSISTLSESLGRSSDLRWSHVEDLSPHYAETLRCWRSRFMTELPAILKLGYEERFLRLWEYYLCYCEAGFRDHRIGVVQIVLDKPERRRTLEVKGAAR